MRTTLRSLLLLGCAGFIALYVLQYSLALAVTPLILLVSACAGLLTAKWLPWAWYGRQFAAGVRAGILACGLSAAGVLLSLVGNGPQTLANIADRSHLLGFDFSGVATSLGTAGWFMAYVLLTAFFALAGVLLSGVVAQVVGWSKSVGTVRVITAAHNAASTLHRTQTWAPASNSAPSIGGYWNFVPPSAGQISQPGLLAVGANPPASKAQAGRVAPSDDIVSQTRSTHDDVLDQQSVYLTPLSSFDFDELDSPLPFPEPLPIQAPKSAQEPIPARRTKSGAQPMFRGMTEDIRQALDRWDATPIPEPGVESETPKKSAAKPAPASKAKVPSKRTPAPSAYLNSEPAAAPRRSRKKQQTRDWLC